MKRSIAQAGNSGLKIRSDCEVKLKLTTEGGIRINLNSKVKSMYGGSIEKTCKDVISYFDIYNAILDIEDSGALNFVIAARVEAAVKLLIDTEKEYLPVMIKENEAGSLASRFRFSRLYLPGNSPSMMLNAGLHSPDGIILDLEDSVAIQKKHEARFIVRNALRQVNFYGAERMVRVNQGEMGIEDLRFIIPHNVNLVLIPKCESPDYIIQVEGEISKLLKDQSLKNTVYLMPIIESALGVERVYDIACASNNITSIAIGLEDYTADMGVQRTNEGIESLYARMRIVNACKAAGIQAIDSVFSDVSDMDALAANVKSSKALGFVGMGCIHPRQIAVIHKAFAPDDQEIEKAKKIVIAFKEAAAKGMGVVSLGSKMIDPPVVTRAEKTIELAVKLNILNSDWENEE